MVPPKMSIRTIDLEQDSQSVLDQIKKEKDIMVLGHAFDQERAKGARTEVLAALEAQRESQYSHGDGAQDLTGGHPEVVTPYTLESPMTLKEHKHGAGAIAKPNYNDYQRAKMQLVDQYASSRTTDIERLSAYTTNQWGIREYIWGNIKPPVKETVCPKTKTLLTPAKGWRPFLKKCPNCGRDNKAEFGEYGSCVHCDYSVIEQLIKKYPDKFPKIDLNP